MSKLLLESIRRKTRYGFLLAIFVSFVLLLFIRPICAQNNQNEEQIAAEFLMKGAYEEAAELYEQLYAKSTKLSYYQALIKTYLELKEYKKAEKLIEKRKKGEVGNLRLSVDLGRVLNASGNRSKAQKEFKEAIKNIPMNAEQIEDLANAFMEINETSYALDTYEAGRKLFKSKKYFCLPILQLYEYTGQYEEFVKEALDMIEENPTFIPDLQIFLQRYFAEQNVRLTQILRKELLKRAQSNSSSRDLAGMSLWFFLQEKDFEFALKQAQSIDKRFEVESASAVFQVAEISSANRNYATAMEAFQYIINKGKESPFYFQSQIGLLNTGFLKITTEMIVDRKELISLCGRYEDILQQVGKTPQSLVLLKNYTHLKAFYLHDIQGASDLLYEAVNAPQINPILLAECKLELGDILLFAGDIWEASLLYMQVEKGFANDVLGAQAKYKNARLSYYIGEFSWAKSQLDVLKASTSKFIANDAMELSLLISDNMDEDSLFTALTYYAKADLMSFRNMDSVAFLLLDTIETINLSHPIRDEVLFKKAEIRIKQSRYQEADSLLQKLILFYPQDILADDALFILAELNEKEFKQPEKAKAYYERILVDYPSSIYATEARKRYYSLKTPEERFMQNHAPQ